VALNASSDKIRSQNADASAKVRHLCLARSELILQENLCAERAAFPVAVRLVPVLSTGLSRRASEGLGDVPLAPPNGLMMVMLGWAPAVVGTEAAVSPAE